LRFVLSNNIAVPCILRGEYPNICINASQPPHSYKLVYAPGDEDEGSTMIINYERDE